MRSIESLLPGTLAYFYTFLTPMINLMLGTQLEKGDEIVSPFHDIPFWVDKEKGTANMVVEIPRGQQAKLEISRDQPFNPIKQDVKVSIRSV